MGKQTMWFSNRPDTNRPVQSQKMAVTAKLICVFVFAYANYWFSHEVAHFLLDSLHQENISVTCTRISLLPHFYPVKGGYTGVYYFSYFSSKT